jgi:hypothetical protein
LKFKATIRPTAKTDADNLVPTLITIFNTGDETEHGAGAAAATQAMQSPSSWLDAAVRSALARFRQWSNPACEQMVKGIADMQGDTMRYRALPFFLVMG